MLFTTAFTYYLKESPLFKITINNTYFLSLSKSGIIIFLTYYDEKTVEKSQLIYALLNTPIKFKKVDILKISILSIENN